MKTKNVWVFSLLIVISIGSALALNSGLAQAPTADEAQVESSSTLGAQLAFATLELDQTEYPIDTEQASQLLPLWKGLRSLSESNSASTIEIEALVNQIQGRMSSDQMAAIAAMDLTLQDRTTLTALTGIEAGAGSPEFTGQGGAAPISVSGGIDQTPPEGSAPGGEVGAEVSSWT